MRGLAAVLVAICWSGSALAQPTPGTCERFAAAFERAADRVARLKAESLIRTQVVEATANATLLSNEIAMLQLNVELMKGSNCPLPKTPVNLDAYVPAMKACIAAAQDRNGDSETACDRATWKPAAPGG